MLKLLLAFQASMTIWANISFAQSAYPEPDVVLSQEDWLIECYGAESRDGNCQLYHRVLMNGGTAIALVFTVAYPAGSDDPFLQMALPLGSDIAFGAKLTFGDGFSQNIPFTRCTDQGCLVEGAITANLLQEMRKTPTGFVEIINSVGPLRIPISMLGYTAALDRISPNVTEPNAQEMTDIELHDVPASPIDSDFTPLTGD
ncbi:MAG: invasion protein IalB [Yoonia sp.]|jgi:invasion protein IalB